MLISSILWLWCWEGTDILNIFIVPLDSNMCLLSSRVLSLIFLLVKEIQLKRDCIAPCAVYIIHDAETWVTFPCCANQTIHKVESLSIGSSSSYQSVQYGQTGFLLSDIPTPPHTFCSDYLYCKHIKRHNMIFSHFSPCPTLLHENSKFFESLKSSGPKWQPIGWQSSRDLDGSSNYFSFCLSHSLTPIPIFLSLSTMLPDLLESLVEIRESLDPACK